MKILIVSNLYPPHYVGGYELRCSQVGEFLHKAGHDVRVLTSSYRQPTEANGSTKCGGESVGGIPVERSLYHWGFEPPPAGRFYTLAMAKRQLRDAQRLIQVLNEFRPDLINWWNLGGLTKSILPIPAVLGIPDLCCVDDNWILREYGVCGENEHLYWFQFWRGNWGPSFLRPLLRKTLSIWAKTVQRQGIATHPFPFHPRHVCFISEFRRIEHIMAGLAFSSSEVIYGGVSPERFYAQRAASCFENGPVRLLYAGYVEPNRGLHTIIEALGLLPNDIRDRVELSIAHSGPPKLGRYVEDIRTRIGQLGLSKTVTFLGKMRHEEMPRVYREHHVVVSASTLPEGLPMSILEGMCAGCAVITTGSGGAAEIADLADLPVFPKEHPLALSKLIAKLVKDRRLVFEIASRGQRVALREFTFARMAERIRDTLQVQCQAKDVQFASQAHLVG